MKQLISGLALAAVLGVGLGCGSNNGIGLKPGINGCTSFNSVAAPAAINFGANLGNTYDQPCIAISANQMVTFNGSFDVHPLRPGLAPSQSGGPDAGSPNNPIQSKSTGTTAQFTFANTGTYPYYCSAHEGQGMFGAIQVR